MRARESGESAQPRRSGQLRIRRSRMISWLRRQALIWRTSLRRAHSPTLLGHPLTHLEVGLAGELLAAHWLKRHGRKILLCNHSSNFGGELDIVARHGSTLTFIEVKTRSQKDHGRPADAVNPKKRQRIQQGAVDWLRMLGKPRLSIRFDIAEVLLIAGERPQVNLIENAFTLPDNVLAGR